MTYLQRNRKKHSGIKGIIIFFVIVLIFRFFNINLITKVLDHPINFVLESNSVILSPLKNTIVYFRSKKELEEKNKELQDQNLNLKLENLLNKTTSDEFENFKKQFGAFPQQNTLFKVILRPPFTPFDLIKITGDLRPYNVGSLVFYKNILIGSIAEKDNSYATVELFSSPQKIVPVVVRDNQFEAKGLGGGRFVFEVPKDFEIKEGDAIIYPSSEIFVLGMVEFTETKEEDLFKKVYFNLPISLNMISYVSIGIQQYEQATPSN